MSVHDPQFKHFYNNPTIQALGTQPRWTASTSKKMPVNMRLLLDTLHDQDIAVQGAVHYDERHLTTLDEICEKLPDVANHAYYLDAVTDGVVVLDIEPGCPPLVAQALLSLPAIYRERSMSGRGYHLLMPLPAAFNTYPNAAAKVQLKDANGWFEILQQHWVTFTRKPVDQMPAPRGVDDYLLDWEALYTHLGKDATARATTAKFYVDIEDEEPHIDGLPKSTVNYIISGMLETPYRKTLADWNYDHSDYEFGLMGHLFNQSTKVLATPAILEMHPRFTPEERAKLIYWATKRVLPERPKHHTPRDNMPLLLSGATKIVASRIDELRARQEKEQERSRRSR